MWANVGVSKSNTTYKSLPSHPREARDWTHRWSHALPNTILRFYFAINNMTIAVVDLHSHVLSLDQSRAQRTGRQTQIDSLSPIKFSAYARSRDCIRNRWFESRIRRTDENPFRDWQRSIKLRWEGTSGNSRRGICLCVDTAALGLRCRKHGLYHELSPCLGYLPVQ
jgi:hypothetical protein